MPLPAPEACTGPQEVLNASHTAAVLPGLCTWTVQPSLRLASQQNPAMTEVLFAPWACTLPFCWHLAQAGLQVRKIWSQRVYLIKGLNKEVTSRAAAPPAREEPRSGSTTIRTAPQAQGRCVGGRRRFNVEQSPQTCPRTVAAVSSAEVPLGAEGTQSWARVSGASLLPKGAGAGFEVSEMTDEGLLCFPPPGSSSSTAFWLAHQDSLLRRLAPS